MIDATFVQEIRRSAWPYAVGAQAGERIFVPPDWEEHTPHVPAPEPLTVSTLSGLVGYIAANVDDLPLATSLLVIESPESVKLVGALGPETSNFRRNVYVRAVHLVPPVSQWMTADLFLIHLMTNFVSSPDQQRLLALVSSIRDSAVRELTDNGVAQEVKTQRGVHLVGMTQIPNPLELQPFRTFPEIDQPASKFIVRMRKGPDDKPDVALFTADGGAWKLTAIRRIADFLGSGTDPRTDPKPSVMG